MSSLFEQINKAHHLKDLSEEKLLTELGVCFGVTGVHQNPPENIFSVKQVHGDRIIKAQRQDPQTPEEADGIYTTAPSSLTIAVKTADCLPVIFASKDRCFGMVVHAGWRGLAMGILKKAVDQAKALGIPPTELIGLIGPAISQKVYEVGPEVLEAFLQGPGGLSSTEFGYAAQKSYADRWHLNVQAVGLMHLMAQGIPPTQISVLHSCTYSHPELWHSFRRDGSRAGRNWTWLRL